jgi:hypothetical protein
MSRRDASGGSPYKAFISVSARRSARRYGDVLQFNGRMVAAVGHRQVESALTTDEPLQPLERTPSRVASPFLRTGLAPRCSARLLRASRLTRDCPREGVGPQPIRSRITGVTGYDIKRTRIVDESRRRGRGWTS